MENVHNAIAWYQKKIGSYDKQLWEQSVEKKLQKQPPFVLHNAPRKKVRLKTEYIDVDLIRGSTFTKTKPQVPWVYITRKAISRILFFPFYYNWWVTQTSKKLYTLLLVLYILQVVTIIVYLRNFDHSITEDELSFTEVILPIILMFLLCLIHSQTVLAHITHKPPKRTKSISGVTRKPRPKKTSRKGRASGNNSTCPEDGGNTDTSKSGRRRSSSPKPPAGHKEAHSSKTDPNGQPQTNQDTAASSIDMEENLMSRSVSDYELKPAINSGQNEPQSSSPSAAHHPSEQLQQHDQHPHHPHHHHHHYHRHHHVHSESIKNNVQLEGNSDCAEAHSSGVEKVEGDYPSRGGVWGDGEESLQKSGCSYNLLDNLPNLLTVEKVCRDVNIQHVSNDQMVTGENHVEKAQRRQSLEDGNVDKVPSTYEQAESDDDNGDISVCVKVISKDLLENVDGKGEVDVVESVGCVNTKETQNQAAVCESCVKRFDSCNEDRPSFSALHSDGDKFTTSESVSTGHCEKHPVALSDQISCCRHASNLEMNGPCMANHSHSSAQARQYPSSYINGASTRALGLRRRSSGMDTAGSHTSGDNGNGEEEMLHYDTQDSCDSGINESPSTFNSGSHRHPNVRDWSLDDDISAEKPVPDTTDHVDSTCDMPRAAFSLARCHHCDLMRGGLSPTSTTEPQSFTSPNTACHTQQDSSPTGSDSSSTDPPTVRSVSSKGNRKDTAQPGTQGLPRILIRPPSVPQDNSESLKNRQTGLDKPQTSSSISHSASSIPFANRNGESKSKGNEQARDNFISESSSHLQCFSEQFVQEILNEETIREMSHTSLLAHSDLENSTSSLSHMSTTSAMSSVSATSSSSSCKVSAIDHIPLSTPSLVTSPPAHSSAQQKHKTTAQHQTTPSVRRSSSEKVKLAHKSERHPLDDSLDQINLSDGERPSDDLSNYNPSDSDADSDGPLNVDLRNRCEEKWKRLRFQEQSHSSDGSGKITISKASTNLTSGTAELSTMKPGIPGNGGGSRSVVGILTRKPSPLKDLAIGRKTSNNAAGTNSSGSDQEQSETRNQLRRRRRTSGTPEESCRGRSVPTSLGLRTESKPRHLSSSENETGGGQTPEGSNKGSSDKEKATMSSEEWEDRMQSDETTSSAYSSNSDVDTEERAEEEEDKTEYTTSTLHVINLLQPGLQPSCLPVSFQGQQSGSPTSSGIVTQPDKVSCVIWEGNDCKKVDLTALDIGWAIIDKVDSLPESSDYFFIGLLFSFLLSLVPLVFRAYASKNLASIDDLMTWSWYFAKLSELPVLNISYSWRQFLVMINGILQRFFLSLVFFFLLSVADRTFKQRLLYAKHFSYLTSSRRARKFFMPHFRLNKVRNIKIWLSLRSYLKRRGPQRSVDVIVSACFLSAVCTVCLISLQMLKDTDSYLDYLCNWELLVWCVALSVFLMRFMTIGLKINKKYRNLSVLITEQINLYLQMEQKPHKKEELILANNVLRLAEDLLKELESPFKISGFSANPLIYNIMRVVVLSAFSAVLTEVLGFKLKLHKIKLKG